MKIDKDKTTTFNKKDDPENTEGGFYDEEDHTQAIDKQISYILQKKDSHTSVTQIKIYTPFLLLLMLGQLIFLLIILIRFGENCTIYLIMMNCSNTFLTQMVIAIYHVRELTLLSNSNYTKIYDNNRTNYFLNHTGALLEIYQRMIMTQQFLNSNEKFLSEYSFNYLNNQTIQNVILSEGQAESVNVSLTTSLSLIMSSIFRISQKNYTKIIPLDDDVFFFMSNANNMDYKVSGWQIELIFQDFREYMKNVLKKLYIYTAVCWLINIIGRVIFRQIYFKVIKERENYIEVFYDIDNEIIINSILKCESLISSINHSEEELFTSSEGEDNESEDDLQYSKIESTITPQKPISNHQKSHKKIANYYCRYYIWVYTITAVTFVILILCLLQIYTVKIYNTILNVVFNQKMMELNSYMAYNNIRAFLFNEENTFNGVPLTKYILPSLHNIYTNFSNREKGIDANMQFIPEISKKRIHSIFHKNICNYSTDFFNTFPNLGKDCSSISDNTTLYGLKIALTYFYEELRGLYYNYVALQRMATYYNFTFNLTLMGTEKEKELWSKGTFPQMLYKFSHPIQIFNLDSNTKIHYLFRYIIYPAFLEFSNIVQSSADTFTREVEKKNNWITIVIISLVAIEYFFGWKIYENSLENEIYKTKKMLSIIPVKSLLKLSNISSLLNLKCVNGKLIKKY